MNVTSLVHAPAGATPLPAVLVVHDAGDLPSRLAQALGRAGFHVTMEAPREGTSRAGESDRFDVIIVKQARDAGGLGFVSRVRRRFPEARVVFATAVGQVLVAQAALDGGSPRSAERMGELVRVIRSAVAMAGPGTLAQWRSREQSRASGTEEKSR